MAKIEGFAEKVLDVGKPIKLIVTTGSGDVHITRRTQDDKVSVVTRFVVRAFSGEEARALAERIKTDPPIEVRNSTIKVGDLSKYRNTEGFSWFWGSSIVMDFDIQVPFETEAEIDSGSGDQNLSGIRGPVRLRAGSGDVKISNIEQESLVETGSGDIEITNASKVTVRAGSGDVSLNAVTGDASVHTGSGDVTLKEITGAIHADAGSGDIKVYASTVRKAQWQLSASSGDVLVVLPADARFALTAEASSGDIEVDFPLTVLGKLSKHALRGTVGESPELEITIETSSGDIRIKKR